MRSPSPNTHQRNCHVLGIVTLNTLSPVSFACVIFCVSLNGVNTIRIFLDNIIEPRKNNPKLLGLKAIYQFLRHRNVDEAITLFKRSRDKDISSWHFNIAFLYAYKKVLQTATREYRKAVSFPIDIAVIMQVDDFICWLLKVEPEKYQLYYCLGFLKWKAKGG